MSEVPPSGWVPNTQLHPVHLTREEAILKAHEESVRAREAARKERTADDEERGGNLG